jgi:predicted dithiol-disulfide oxidoreductase (DUF899 family)
MTRPPRHAFPVSAGIVPLEALLGKKPRARRRIERVADLRRKLPLGGAVVETMRFRRVPRTSTIPRPRGAVRLSELFVPGKDSLLLYGFMYGPAMERPCPMCTAMLDSLNGAAPHVRQRVNLAVVARSPVERIRAYARARGWHNLRLLSSAANDYNRDYHAEAPDGSQLPVLNVFVRRPDASATSIRRSCSSGARAASTPPRSHLPLWNFSTWRRKVASADWSRVSPTR